MQKWKVCKKLMAVILTLCMALPLISNQYLVVRAEETGTGTTDTKKLSDLIAAGEYVSVDLTKGEDVTLTKQKAYVQFSKRIVLLVTTAVTVISLLAVVLCFFRSDTEALISTVRTYINYATIVFAAYSSNSVFEKWLTQGKSADAAGDTEEK